MYEIENYRGANNRAYYAIYHAISAVHALDVKAYKKHKDVIANFNFSYVKTQIFDPSLGKRINEAEKIRHASDYDDFYVVSISETQDQIQTAIDFVEAVEKYCENRINN